MRSALRTIFFIPSIVPQFVSAMVWLWIFNQQYGLINAVLYNVGMKGIPWLSSPDWSKPSLVLVTLWASGTTMVIFLAALQDVPRELYEAARLDGAAPRQELWHITIPMVTPAVLFNMLIGLIGAFQYFTFAWIMTRGGPVRSTEFFGLYLYKNAFEGFRMGYASAMAWILFILTVITALIIFRTSARWVYYGGEQE
jgi:multiple sugar transport system permease protein